MEKQVRVVNQLRFVKGKGTKKDLSIQLGESYATHYY